MSSYEEYKKLNKQLSDLVDKYGRPSKKIPKKTIFQTFPEIVKKRQDIKKTEKEIQNILDADTL